MHRSVPLFSASTDEPQAGRANPRPYVNRRKTASSRMSSNINLLKLKRACARSTHPRIYNMLDPHDAAREIERLIDFKIRQVLETPDWSRPEISRGTIQAGERKYQAEIEQCI